MQCKSITYVCVCVCIVYSYMLFLCQCHAISITMTYYIDICMAYEVDALVPVGIKGLDPPSEYQHHTLMSSL